MKPHVKNSISDSLGTILCAALVLLPLWLPHAPMFVQVPIGILVLCLGLFLVASALRDHWRLSKSTGQFVGYYFRLVAAAIAIIVTFLLLFLVIGSHFFT
jgi:hypothetical protein